MHRIRQSILFVFALLFFISYHPTVAFSAEYTAVFSLSTGEYMLVCPSGRAMDALLSEGDEMPWITGIPVQAQEGVVTGDNLPLWTLTVTESGVILQDRNGVFIAPAPEGQNGIIPGEYYWQVDWNGTTIAFHGVSGEKPVVLAQNGEAGFRAYDKNLTEGGDYPCRFTLYQLTQTEPEVPSEPTEPSAPEKTEPTEPEIPGPGLYFGQLHSHSDLSDSTVPPDALYEAAKEQGLDFLAITDHSNSLSDDKWAAGQEAAQNAAENTFVPLYGYEMSWPSGMGLGHISTFRTPGYISYEDAGFDNYASGLQNYYAALAAEPDAISQFNHPGTFYGDFRDFGFYNPEYDDRLNLLEVFCGDGLPDGLAYYDQALELGWHVAPTAGSTHDTTMSQSRTVVYANSLTEDGLYDALRNRRVYATQDQDLSILYYLDGHFMGSRLLRQNLGQIVTLQVSLSDPTDTIGRVEVIFGGEMVAEETVDKFTETVEFSLPTQRGSYYIRVTQPDGQMAVTAPIWIEGGEMLGISSFSADTLTPVQGQLLHLNLELYNEEPAALKLENISLTIGEETVLTTDPEESLLQGQTKVFSLPLTYYGLGYTTITATVTASLEGQPRTFTQTLTLSFRPPEMITGILVDGTHGASVETTELAELAAAKQIRVTVETEAITQQSLTNYSILLIPAPQMPLEDSFPETVREFARQGGMVILMGEGSGETSAPELNRLLEALGATMRFRTDTARDEENNGGSPSQLYLSSVNGESVWTENRSSGQVYRHADGCTIDAGLGSWLVKGYETTSGSQDCKAPVVLAVEGRIFAAGSNFLSDEDLKLPENIWAEPFMNRTIAENILGIAQVQLPLSTIADVRNGEAGQTHRIRGYVTAGTSNPYTTFPDTLYLQDDTGGIALMPFRESDIAVGTPMEVVGYLKEVSGNLVFHPVSYEVLKTASYRYQPAEAPWNQLLDNTLYGGQLVQVEGVVMGMEYAADRTISGLFLEDDQGNYALVHIEPGIRSGDTGEGIPADYIQQGYTVRAMGILFLRNDGAAAVRVRNCDEVVYVPPITYVWKAAKKDNPKVGDSIGIYVFGMLASGLLLAGKRRKK